MSDSRRILWISDCVIGNSSLVLRPNLNSIARNNFLFNSVHGLCRGALHVSSINNYDFESSDHRCINGIYIDIHKYDINNNSECGEFGFIPNILDLGWSGDVCICKCNILGEGLARDATTRSKQVIQTQMN